MSLLSVFQQRIYDARNLFVLLVCVLTATSINAQEPYIIPLHPADDILPTTTFYVFRDKSDIMWIATNSGVYRYDGYTFTHYTSGDGLGDNEILRIFQDIKGRIWFQPINGNLSYYKDGKIFNAENDTLIKQLVFNKMVLSECEDAKGNFYFAGRSFELYKVDVNDRVYKSKAIGLENFIWLGEDGKIKLPPVNKFPTRLVRGHTYKDLHLISNQTTVYKVVHDTTFEKLFTLPSGSSEIVYVHIQSPEEVFLGTRNGLYIWNLQDNSFRYMMEGRTVTSACTDFEGNTWLSTLEEGIYIMPNPDVFMWKAFYGLPDTKVTCLETAPDGKLWIGCANSSYAVMDQNTIVNIGNLPGAPKMDIMNIRHNAFGTFVLGKAGILQIKEGMRTFIDVYANDLLLQDDGFVYVAQDNTMRITEKQFFEEVYYIVYNITQRRMLYDIVNARTNTFAGHDGVVYIGTSRGLFKYVNGTTISIGISIPELNSPIRDIAFDEQNGKMYVATMNGLVVIQNGEKTDVLGRNDGLPNSECNAIHIDSTGNIWAAYGNELIKLSYQNGKYTGTNYTKYLRIECARITDIDITQGMVYAATENGLIGFAENIQLKTPEPPLVNISGFAVNGISRDIAKPIDLSWKDNDITVNFTGVSYTSGSRIDYSYYISGYDTAWHTTTDRSVQIKSLPPGDYAFMVRARNIAGIESPNQIVYFSIVPPVWTQWWFIVLSILFVSAGIVLGWQMRLRSVKSAYQSRQRTIQLEMEHAEAERKIEQLNQQVFRQQMNPHFIFNALNTIKGYYAENDIKNANEYISKFSKLLRTILENNEQWIPIEKEIQALTLYLDLAAMRYNYKFTYTFITESPLLPGQTGIPPMLLQPFIENALVHGIGPKQGSGNITIKFSEENEHLICTIEDDGIGRQASATRSRVSAHNSKATQIITEYLRALNDRERKEAFQLLIEDIILPDGTAGGTRIRLSMPKITLVP